MVWPSALLSRIAELTARVESAEGEVERLRMQEK